jgi:hypothetical protein
MMTCGPPWLLIQHQQGGGASVRPGAFVESFAKAKVNVNKLSAIPLKINASNFRGCVMRAG